MVDLAAIPTSQWIEAQRRAEVVRPLAERSRCPRRLARVAAQELGISERRVYALVRRMREAGGTLSSLLPKEGRGGRGRGRLAPSVEELTAQIIEDVYLTSQKRNAAEVVREVRRRFASAGMPAPSANTIRRRIKALPASTREKRGEPFPAGQPVTGATPLPLRPLDFVQMDHTPVDLIVVDPIDRLPIGRPYLTLAIDVFSRCIAGFHLSLDAPSATGVGLCLTHMASDKAPWLEARHIDARWPVVGKPRRIGVDNGRRIPFGRL